MIKDQHGSWQASIGNETDGKQDTSPTPNSENTRPVAPNRESKIVLLVDGNSRTRESRVKVFRNRGVSVHCAASADTARDRLASTAYDLVLVDPGQDFEAAEKLVQEIRTKNPRQRAAFLVGQPLYVAASLKPASQSQQTRLTEVEPALRPQKLHGISDFGQRIRDAEAKAGI